MLDFASVAVSAWIVCNEQPVAVLVTLSLCVLSYRMFVHHSSSGRLRTSGDERYIPTPPGLPIIGNLLGVLRQDYLQQVLVRIVDRSCRSILSCVFSRAVIEEISNLRLGLSCVLNATVCAHTNRTHVLAQFPLRGDWLHFFSCPSILTMRCVSHCDLIDTLIGQVTLHVNQTHHVYYPHSSFDGLETMKTPMWIKSLIILLTFLEPVVEQHAWTCFQNQVWCSIYLHLSMHARNTSLGLNT